MKPIPSSNKEKNSLLLQDSEYTSYFQSKMHEIAFYFKMNNSIFDKYLGIKRIHTIDHSKANELKKSYLQIFHPDRHVKSDSELDYDQVCHDINATFHRVSGGKL